MKTPWIFRHCPKRFIPALEKIVLVIGYIGYISFYIGGLFAIFFGPLAFAAWRPHAPISQPVIWLKNHTDKDSFQLAYILIQGFVTVILFCGAMLFEYLRFKRLLEKESIVKTEKDRTRRCS